MDAIAQAEDETSSAFSISQGDIDDALQSKGTDSKYRIYRQLTHSGDKKENIALCGTRGWLAGQPDAHSGKVYAREVGRLRASLAYAHKQFPFAERVAVLHYPPIYAGGAAREMLDAMAQYGVKRCFYGHLHAAAIRRAVQGNVEGVEYRLISADALQFHPYKI